MRVLSPRKFTFVNVRDDSRWLVHFNFTMHPRLFLTGTPFAHSWLAESLPEFAAMRPPHGPLVFSARVALDIRLPNRPSLRIQVSRSTNVDRPWLLDEVVVTPNKSMYLVNVLPFSHRRMNHSWCPPPVVRPGMPGAWQGLPRRGR